MKPERRQQITAPRPAVGKRPVWAEIQRRDPAFASDLAALCKAFGKPAGLRVEIDGDVLIDTLTVSTAALPLFPCLLTLAKPPVREASVEMRPEELPTLDDLKSASPERLARMKAVLKRKAKTRERR